jgi:hypothetical protein
VAAAAAATTTTLRSAAEATAASLNWWTRHTALAVATLAEAAQAAGAAA